MNKENNIALALVIALLVLFLFGGFGMMSFGGFGGMMSGYYGSFGFIWLFGWLIKALLVIALVLFILWLINQTQREKNRRKKI